MMMADIIGAINASSIIAIVTHINPDGDAIGSSLALMHAIKNKGKEVQVYCQDDIPQTFDFLAGVKNIRKPELIQNTKYDLVIALDCSDMDRMGSCNTIFNRSERSANIDHHISNTRYAQINIVDGKAAATGEIIFELIKKLINFKDKNIARALYTSIVSDTGRFAFSNTTSRTHRVVAELLDWGADQVEISNQLFKNYSLTKLHS